MEPAELHLAQALANREIAQLILTLTPPAGQWAAAQWAVIRYERGFVEGDVFSRLRVVTAWAGLPDA